MCPVVLKSSRPWHIISFTSYKCKTSLCAWYQYDQLIFLISLIYQVQFSSVVQLCPTLCHPIDYIKPGFPVHHQLPELTQTHIHWVSNAIQPSHPLLSPSPSALNLSQHQGLFLVTQFFTSSGQSIGVSALASFLPMNIQDWFPLG